jgi:hypothetical protein
MVDVWNGPNLESLTERELADLLATAGRWDNAELAVERSGAFALVARANPGSGSGAVAGGFLVRVDGLSPRADEDSPETQPVVDSSGATITVTSRHLIPAERAVHVLASFAQTGARAPTDENGSPLAWGFAVVSNRQWQNVGDLERLSSHDLYEDDLVALVYGTPPTIDEDDAEEGDEDDDLPPGEKNWNGQVGVLLEERRLNDEEATSLPNTALWPVLRRLHRASDGRWLELLAQHPMPWLRSLMVTTNELEALNAAVRALPRLVELAIHAKPDSAPILEAPALGALVLDLESAALVGRVLAASKLPALRTLVLHDDALDDSIDLSGLDPRAVVMLAGSPDVHLAKLAALASAPVLWLEPPSDASGEDLVGALASRADRLTVVPRDWPGADAAAQLAAQRGVRLRVG